MCLVFFLNKFYNFVLKVLPFSTEATPTPMDTDDTEKTDENKDAQKVGLLSYNINYNMIILFDIIIIQYIIDNNHSINWYD